MMSHGIPRKFKRCWNLPFLAGMLLAAVMCSCGNHNSGASKYSVPGDTLTREARFLQMVDCGEFTAVDIFVPWMDSVPLASYAIFQDSAGLSLCPDGYQPVLAPIKRSAVFSSVYTSGLEMLGALDGVAGVADGNYYLSSDTVYQLLKNGNITDVGSSMSPLVEKLVDIEPDAILLSPYAGVSEPGIEQLGVPMIWMADYLEATPLARAEWILLLGELYGKRPEAQNIYESVSENYNNIKQSVSSETRKPKVVVDRPMSGVWYVPGGQSYMAKMLEDAGADYPWADTKNAASLPLDEASVIEVGADADIWLIKDANALTPNEISVLVPHSKVFKAFPEKTYLCNTLEVPYYNLIAFRPDTILADMATLFHPEIFDHEPTKFYRQIKK